MEQADQARFGTCDCATPQKGGGFDGLLRGLVRVSEHALDAENIAAKQGLLQDLDPRTKVAGAFLAIVSVILLHSLAGLAALFLCAVLLAALSRVPVRRLARQVWMGVLIFTGVIAMPAPFLVPGDTIAVLPVLGWTISAQGLRSAAFLIARAETSATFALLLILTTPWPHVMKALRSLGVPVAVVAILGMTHRYIFVLLTTATQMFEARRSRSLAPMSSAARRKVIISSAGVLLGKTLALAGDVHMAMISRGYRGEVRLIDDFRFRRRDYASLGIAAALPALIVWMQQ